LSKQRIDQLHRLAGQPKATHHHGGSVRHVGNGIPDASE
jgi:hypothetical protein